MRPFEDLLVWQKAHELTLEVYRCTRGYPAEERYGLVAQTRRAAASVAANISEGCGKRTKPQLRHSLDIAAGSLSELQYWLIIGRDLGLLEPAEYTNRARDLNEVRRLLLGLTAWADPRS